MLAIYSSTLGRREERLVESCLDIIASNAEQIIEQPAFLQLPSELLIPILESDNLVVKEVDLFLACLSWAKHNQKKKSLQESFATLCPYIRFPLMSVAELSATVAPSNVLPQQVLLDLFIYVGSVKTVGQTQFRSRPRLEAEDDDGDDDDNDDNDDYDADELWLCGDDLEEDEEFGHAL